MSFIKWLIEYQEKQYKTGDMKTYEAMNYVLKKYLESEGITMRERVKSEADVKLPPCMNCKDRYLKVEDGVAKNCHSNCKKYLTWKEDLLMYKQKAKVSRSTDLVNSIRTME